MSPQRLNLVFSDENYFLIRKTIADVIEYRVKHKIAGKISQQEVINIYLDIIRENLDKFKDEIVKRLAKK